MFVPLNIKTDSYLQSSMISIKSLINYAVKNNLYALTITDNNMYGVIDFYKACKSNNIKPIVGLEVKIDDFIIILYAKGYEGYLNLVKLSTVQSEEKLDLLKLVSLSSNLLCIIPYESISLYDKLKDYFNDLFISYKNISERNHIKYSNKVYMNSICYLNPNNHKYMKYLEAIREGLTVKFIDTDYKDNYLKLESDIINDDINNNYYICDICNLEIKFNNDILPKYNNSLGISSYDYLKRLCINGAKIRFGTSIGKNYQDRLKYELSIISKMGFSDYFLIVSDYVNFAKENGIIVGSGRGSAVGSLVAYLLNITDVDPLKYELLFERFLNPERVSMPDIDIDFEHDKRDIVINYCMNKYGKKKVAPIISFDTLGAKAAIRDLCRCLDINNNYIDSICKLLDSRISLAENYKTNKRLKDFLSRKKELYDLYINASFFEGLKRHTSIHAAGIVMSSIDLDNIIPLDYHDTFYTSGYDMTYLEEIGLLKMDFLGIKYLTTIHNIIDLVNITHDTDIKFDDIPIDDDAINIFTKADTVGIFQFESTGMINFLSKFKPNTFEDLVACIALYRPGPMKNIDTFIRRKHGLEKIDYIDETLEEILKPTYGIIVYQEQIMQIAHVMASFSLAEADILRKAMSKKKKDILEKERDNFINRSIKNGYSSEVATKVYDLMLKFAEYGFNKSHSVGYSVVSAKMAYLKAHYRCEFYTCLLDSEKGSKDKVKYYIYELRKYGIDVESPSINLSTTSFTINNNKIIYPLTSIKGINLNIASAIIEERNNGLYKDIFDFISRCLSKTINKKVISSLILAGCFENQGYNRKTLIDNLDIIINYGELLKDVGEYALMPEIILKNEYTHREIMNIELDSFGHYLKNNPVSIARGKYRNTVMLSDIEKYFDRVVNIVILVDSIKSIKTKNNEKMAFINGSDELSDISIVLFPKTYEKYNISKNDIIYVTGRVEKRFDKYQIIANNIEKIIY